MNKFKLLLLLGTSSANASGKEEVAGDPSSEIHVPDLVVTEVDTLVEKLKSISFDENSEEVSNAYAFFSGQNILNVKDVDYRQWYSDGKTNKEILCGLFLALKEFLTEDGTKFKPDDLNGGFTRQNYEFLNKIFEYSDTADKEGIRMEIFKNHL